MTDNPRTVVDGLRASAREFGNDHGIRYYTSTETSEYRGYGDLDENARRIAHALTVRGYDVGDTIVIGLTNGLAVADAAFGAMYAGLAFVPAPLAGYGAGAAFGKSVGDIAAAAGASALLVDDAVRERLGESADDLGIPVLLLEEVLAEGDPAAWSPAAIDQDTIAYLLFTSGSTGDPKGVIATHRTVMATAATTGVLFGVDKDAVMVGWAPMHHLMGLAIQAIYPAVSGAQAVVCATEVFQRRPVFWLQMISMHRGTVSAGGNFAFALCTQLATDEQIAELDLSSLVALFSGTEPVRPETVRAFLERFAPTGLTAKQVSPVYGMTEATLIAGKFPDDELVIRRFDTNELENGRLVPDDGPGSVEWVSCGRWADHTVLKLVDPDTLVEVPEGDIGEIWLSTPIMSPGYFRRPDATAETFGLTLAGDDHRFLRSGDLAAVLDGEIYITGRLKDLIIIRGRNLYPQDLEAGARLASPAVGISAVFELDDQPSAVGIVLEASEEALTEAGETPATLAAKVRETLIARFSLPSVAVAVVPENRLPRTPTGKVRRQPTRGLLMAGELQTVHVSGLRPDAA